MRIWARKNVESGPFWEIIRMSHCTRQSSDLEIGGKEAGHNLWKNDIDWGHNINWLEQNGSKMTDKSTSTRPSASVYAHCNIPACWWHTHSHHDSSKADLSWVVAQFLEIPSPSYNSSSHSLAYEITHHYKNWQPHTLVPFSPSEMAHTLSVECISLYINPLLTYHFVSHWILSASRTWVSLSPKTRCVISVGRPWVLAGFESRLHGVKSQSGSRLGSSPSCVGSSSNLRCIVSIWS